MRFRSSLLRANRFGARGRAFGRINRNPLTLSNCHVPTYVRRRVPVGSIPKPRATKVSINFIFPCNRASASCIEANVRGERSLGRISRHLTGSRARKTRWRRKESLTKNDIPSLHARTSGPGWLLDVCTATCNARRRGSYRISSSISRNTWTR